MLNYDLNNQRTSMARPRVSLPNALTNFSPAVQRVTQHHAKKNTKSKLTGMIKLEKHIELQLK